jgi:hypothetical protein
MRRLMLTAALMLAGLSTASAAPLQPELSGLGFLLGNWAGGGKVADTGGTARGTSRITAEAGGAVLQRHDHTDLFDAAGKPTGGFDQLMTVYAEGGAIHGDYFDGSHVIHYVQAEIKPGRQVVFTSASGAGPTFRLTYERKAPDSLEISFAMAPPGQATFNPIATGTVHRVR